MKNNYIGQAWLVLALALSFGAALAGVETWLGPRIERNKRDATIREIPNVVPGADRDSSAEAKPLEVGGDDGTRYDAFRALTGSGVQIGWVVKASGKGFADKIELLIGLDARATAITGLSILDQKETPGLGSRIAEPAFRRAFGSRRLSARRRLTVVTAGPASVQQNQVQAVLGATISSQSVCNIINEALSKELRDELVAALPAGASTQTKPAKE